MVVDDRAMLLPSMGRWSILEGVVREAMVWGCVSDHGGDHIVKSRRPWWKHIGLSCKFDEP